MSFFPFRGAPWTPKPRKTRGFLIAPGWNSGNAKGTKHRKSRGFWTPRAEYTVNYKGSGEPEVSPRSPPWGRRLGRLASITFGYQPKASGKGTARLGSGRRPDLRATAHAADPKDQRQQSLMSVGMRKRNSENMGYRSCRSDKYPVRGVRKLTTN